MKRIIPFLLILGVLIDALYCTVIRPQMSGGDFLRSLGGNVQKLAHSSCAQQFVSGKWLFSQPLDPLALVPQDALLMLDTQNAAAIGKTFLHSRFGQTVTTIKWPTVLKQFDIPSPFLPGLKHQFSSLKTLLEQPLLQDIFTRRTVLAFIAPDNPQQFWSNPVKNVLAQILLITSPRQENTSAELLALRRANRHIDTVYYQGVAILSLDMHNEQTLYAAALDGQLVFSLSLPPLQRSIDLFERHFIRRKNGLLRVDDYVKMKQAAKGQDDFFLYANLIALKKIFGQQDAALSSASGTRSMSLFHQRQGTTDYFRSTVRFSPEHLQALQREFYTAKPQRTRSLQLMPAELLLYFWTSWLDAPFLQKIIRANKENSLLASAEAWLKKQTKMDLEELVSLFGPEFSFNIAEISTESFFPVPRLGFVIAAQKQKKVERFLRKLFQDLPLKEKKTNGITIVSLQAAKGLMQPSYAVTDGFLLMADSREQLVDILSDKKEKMVLDKSFQAVDTGMLRPSNLLLFARGTELLNGLQEFVAWAGTMIAVRDEEAGAKSKVLIDDVISPLLDGLSNLATVSLRSSVQPGELILETAAWHHEQTKRKEK